jgi:hypothetical protein
MLSLYRYSRFAAFMALGIPIGVMMTSATFAQAAFTTFGNFSSTARSTPTNFEFDYAFDDDGP